MARGKVATTHRDNSMANREQAIQEDGAVQPTFALGQEQFCTIIDRIHTLSKVVQILHKEVRDKRPIPVASEGSRRS